MAPWQLRDLAEADVDQVIGIWEESRDTAADPAVTLAEMVISLRAGMPAVVAEIEDRIVGAVVASITQKPLSARSARTTLLDQFGGAVPEGGLWQSIAGMREEKSLIE